MTIKARAMNALALGPKTDLHRWVFSAAVVTLAHGAIIAAVALWRPPAEPQEASGAIVIDIAPSPSGAIASESDLPPGPEQVMSEASPALPFDTPQQEKIDTALEKPIETPPELAPALRPELAMPEPAKQEQKEETLRGQDLQLPVPVTTAPPPVPGRTAALPSARSQGRPNAKSSNAVPSWASRIAAQLERHKRYPPEAQSRGEHGEIQISFTLDRQGRVLESRVLRSSGAASLDAEALALLQRAQPFPPPPGELPGPRVELKVPIRFDLR